MMKTPLILILLIGLSSTSQALVYTFDPITEYRVYPLSTVPDDYITDKLFVRTCAGEFVALTFVVKYPVEYTSLLPIPSDLTFSIFNIPSENIDIKGVKCWYQKGDQLTAPSDDYRLYLPELLLNDDDLVHVNYIGMNEGTNYLRTSTGYVSINNPGEGSEFAEIYDSETLLPLSLPANTNKQYWVTVRVPEGTSSGLYKGTISITNDGEQIESLPLEVRVLPFTLPESPIDMSVFYSQALSADGLPALGQSSRSQTQLSAEFRNLKNHGVTNPSVQQNYFSSSARFNTYLQIREEEGLDFKDIYYYSGEIGIYSYFDTIPEINQNVPLVMNAIKNNYDTENVYFYCDDEDNLVPWALFIIATHALGAKTACAQDNSESILALNYIDPNTGQNHPLLNYCVLGGQVVRSIVNAYHAKNLLIGSYGHPQSGLEQPLLYRRNYGLYLWQYDVDVAQTFAYAYGNYQQGYRLLWNDWNWPWNSYKIHIFAYPTTNGVVDTIEWEGYREGVNDVRYLTKLQNTIEEAKLRGINTIEGETYLANLKLENLQNKDMSVIREQLIDYILLYEGNPVPGFEFLFVLLGIIVLIRRRKK